VKKSEKKFLKHVIADLENELCERDSEARKAKRQLRVFSRVGIVLIGGVVGMLVDYVVSSYTKNR
jgi:hypothetical protein